MRKPVMRKRLLLEAFDKGTGRATNGGGKSDLSSLRAHNSKSKMRFSLQLVRGGLYVEREEIPSCGLRTLQSMCFSDHDGFVRWCDGDPVRFEHPVLHLKLRDFAEALCRGNAAGG